MIAVKLIHHTECGMLTFTDDDFKASIQEETGIKPPWAAEAFADLDADVRQSHRPDQGQPVRAAHRRRSAASCSTWPPAS